MFLPFLDMRSNTCISHMPGIKTFRPGKISFRSSVIIGAYIYLYISAFSLPMENVAYLNAIQFSPNVRVWISMASLLLFDIVNEAFRFFKA